MNARFIFVALTLVLIQPCFADTQTRTSAFEYDPTSGLLVREIIEPGDSALCVATTYGYDAFGNRTSGTTRNCNGTSSGGITEAAAPTGDPVFAPRTSRATYDAGSVVINGVTYNWSTGQFATSRTNALSHIETRQFDPRFGGVASLTGPNGITTGWTYDGFGRKSSETRADSTATNWFYERCVDIPGTCPNFGQYRVRVTATGAPTRSTYHDSLAREIRSETQGFDGIPVRKDTQFDALGRVARVSGPFVAESTQVWTAFQYDTLGRVTQIDEPSVNGASTRTRKDYNGLVTTVTVSNAGTGAGMPGGATQVRTTTKNSQGQVTQITQQ